MLMEGEDEDSASVSTYTGIGSIFLIVSPANITQRMSILSVTMLRTCIKSVWPDVLFHTVPDLSVKKSRSNVRLGSSF
jgi:hypothetical protein